MHKFKSFVLIGGTLILAASSCAPVYRCGDRIPDKLPGGKRLKAVVIERDELCTNLAMSQSENADLTARLNESIQNNQTLRQEFDNLRALYDDLRNENVSQAQQFNTALQQKSNELNEKERLLAEREKSLREMQQIISRQDSITRSLNDLVRNALLGFNSDELTVEIRNGKVYVSMSDKLLFRSGSADVEQKGRQALRVLGDVLRKNEEIDVLVEGHTDNVPIRTARFRDNWDLSVARATSIVRILTDEQNISPTRVTASGKGEFMPRASNDTADGRALNRRTEIILSPKLDELMKILTGN
ncbi:OmpA family protein [Cecembia calidifontis]|jgi:chemotaxis protein MotB|uniref:Chemotaxis protein MotB n=1 Tax=Cecembia calidifontis TaxID=1187080 RepID=A0A4Q7P5W8_9BACT|nr:OmpA family protein [Cecembia calidifontis]RZS95453.1 chemotaxis protein MotB [Cecembia calidifontis]